MSRVHGNIFLSRKIFVKVLLIWCLINATVPFKCNPYMQDVAIVFAIWAFIILLKDVGKASDRLFDFPGSKLFMLFTMIVAFSSLLALISDGTDGIVQNIYTLIAIVINIYIVYNNRFDKNTYRQCFRLGYIISLIIVIISHLTLLMHLNIEMSNMEGKIFTIGIERGENRFTGLLGNPNDLGRLALFGLLCLLLYWSMSEIKHKFEWSISAVLFWLCIMLSESRGVIYSLFAALLLTGIVYVIVRYRRDSMPLLGKAGMLLTVFFLWSALLIASHAATRVYYNFANVFEKRIVLEVGKMKGNDGTAAPIVMVEERTDSGKGFSTGRSFLIRLGVSTTCDYSVFTGLTPGNSKEKCTKYMNENWNIDSSPSAAIGNTHNTLIQSFVNYGIFGFTVLVAAALAVLFKLVKQTVCLNFTSKSWKGNTLILFVVFSMAVLSMVENVFLYSFENEPINLLFMLVLGFFFRRKQWENNGQVIINEYEI